MPPGYTPVIPLAPLDLNELTAPISNEPITQCKDITLKPEIEEGKAKNTLKEIISEIDSYAEKDRDLKEAIGSINKADSKKVRYNIVRLSL